MNNGKKLQRDPNPPLAWAELAAALYTTIDEFGRERKQLAIVDIVSALELLTMRYRLLWMLEGIGSDDEMRTSLADAVLVACTGESRTDGT